VPEEGIAVLEDAQALPARPSGRSTMKMKMYEEDVRMMTLVACNKDRRILISH
jgi:hypothetical protein